MVLANIAYLLATDSSYGPTRVLMIDWDLEAPGLHRYFCNRLVSGKKAPIGRTDDNCDLEPGLIDLFYELDDKIDRFKDQSKVSGQPMPFGEETARNIFDDIHLDKYIIQTKISGLSLLKAGRFNSADTNEYPERVNKFSWEALYQKSPQLIRVFAEVLAEKYDYVLIDSRTGITDISGVCTMLLPEKLVVVFTPNMQSLMGAVEVVRRATEYRKESDDLRSLMVFPLVSRVESNEPDLRYAWRHGNADKKITGYQGEFEKVLAEAYQKDHVSLDTYFDEMQIQHIPRYAYGEEIAVLDEKTDDRFSLKRSYRAFANKLIEHSLPWEQTQIKSAVYSPPNFSANYIPDTVAMRPLNSTAKPLLYLALLAPLGVIAVLMVYFLRSSSPAPMQNNNTISNSASSPTNAETTVVGRTGQLNIDTNLRANPVAYARSLGIHYKGARVEILEETKYSIGTEVGKWYLVRVTENGCMEKDANRCGNDLNGVQGMAATEGWMNSKSIVIDDTSEFSGEPESNLSPVESGINDSVLDVTAHANSPTDGFLELRSEPSSKTGVRITKIPNGDNITILTCHNDVIFQGARARWCVATYKGQTGWVFDAYVKY